MIVLVIVLVGILIEWVSVVVVRVLSMLIGFGIGIDVIGSSVKLLEKV